MSAELARFLRLASGPVMLRAELRAHQQAVGGLAAEAHLVRTAGVRLPADLAGGSILEVVGGRLRRALEALAPTEPAADPPNRPPAGWNEPPDPGQKPTQRWAAASPAPPPRPSDQIPVGQAATGRPPPPTAPGDAREPATRRLGSPPAGAFEAPMRMGDAWPSAADAHGRPGPSTSDGPTSHPLHRASVPPAARPGSTLAALTRLYWSPASGQLDGRPVPAAPAGPAPTPPARPWSAPPPEGDPAVGGWPELAAGQALTRLRAAAEPGAVPFHAQQLVETDAGEKLEIQNVFNVEVHANGGPGPSLDDFGEQLATVLREQALQHGVEVS